MYGPEGIDGAFCGSTCGDKGKSGKDSECGEGYKCESTTDIAGNTSNQCVRDPAVGSGACPCSVYAGTKQLATFCKADKKRVDGAGTVKCPGTRRCAKPGNDGLTECDAQPPSAETCDELDNDCNGVTDDPAKVCNDDNSCTFDKCAPASSEANGEGCVHTSLSGDPCDDGDICTASDKCLAGKCASGQFTCECKTTADCASKNGGDKCKAPWICDQVDFVCQQAGSDVKCDTTGGDCSKSSCQPQSGKCETVVTKDGTDCADGDPCTVAAECKGGSCEATASCQCAETADCAKLEDGNPCTGTLYCEKTGKPGDWKCKANPASVVLCAKDKDTACLKSSCHPENQKCLMTPQKDGAACEDGTFCTASDSCAGGLCEGGASTCSCATDSDCATKDDGDVCNGTTYCDKTSGKCQVNPSTVVACPTVDDAFCVSSVCAKLTGQCKLTPRNDNQPCDDDNPCTKGETCATGDCEATPLANTCSCTNDDECAGQEDGDLCNGTLFCNKAAGKCEIGVKTVVQCQTVDDTACRANTCDPKTGKCGLKAQNSGFGCDDGSNCTDKDVCSDGVCKGIGTCLCAKDADCAKADDGNACNGTLVCSVAEGQCIISPKSVVICDKASDGQCRRNVCDAKTGACAMKNVNVGHACEDGNKCTAGDYCKPTGKCEGAVDKKLCPCTKDGDCDDGKSCTVDVCQPAAGCVQVKIDVSCNDGNGCTVNECEPSEKGANSQTGCATNPAANAELCDDGDVCTADDTCDGKGGCAGKSTCGACKTNADCVDVAKADLCAAEKACVAGQCKTKPGSAVTCAPTNQPCRANRCNANTGACEMGAIKALEGQSCDDGSACTDKTTCVKGACTGPSTCGCAKDADCAAKEDGNACNGTLKCVVTAGKGSCLVDPLTVVDCDPRKNLACVKLQCKPKTGECGPTLLVGDEPCDDGNPCTGSETKPDGCKDGACAGGPSQCLCQTEADCKAKEDGNACTGTLTCIGFKCVVKAGTAKQCADAVGPCEQAFCDPKLGTCGKTAANDGWACEDGNKCTAGDHCTAGKCAATSKIAGCCTDDAFCADGVACTKDTCDPGTKDVPSKGCLNVPVNAVCDDGNACVTNTCAPLAKGAVDGCENVTVTNGAACDDGDACTGAVGATDGCVVGLCAAGTVVTCDDGDACTADSCDAKAGCSKAAVVCKDDGNPCTSVACDKAKGCVTQGLKDGAACKTNGADGTCKTSKCEATKLVAADLDHDGLVGTDDACPTVWNPDGDKAACPAWDVAGAGKTWAKSAAVGLTEPGLAKGLSKVRRTNEPVEIPLVNGILNSSVVGYWPAGSGTDLSENEATAAKNAADLVTGVFGDKAGATHMNAQSCVTTLKRTAHRVRHGTAMLWFKLDKTQVKGGPTYALVRMQDNAKSVGSYELLQADGTVQFHLVGAESVVAPTSGLNTAWHHVAATWDETTASLYIDGTWVADGKRSSVSISPDTDLRIGCYDGNSAKRFLGVVDDVLYFNRALSPREIDVYLARACP